MQVLYLQQPGVGWHQVPCVEPDDISWDHRGGQRNLFLNVLNGVPGLELHQEIQDYAEQYDRKDDQPADVLSERKRYAACNYEDDDERIAEKTKEAEQGSETRLMD